MAVRPESVEDWFHFVPTLLDNEGWQTVCDSSAGRLLHQNCPWGGHLVRFSLKDIEVHNPPADTSYLFVRPETRLWARCTYQGLNEELSEVVQQVAPGHAVVHRRSAWRFNRQCQVFFLLLGQRIPSTECWMVRRNYPGRGDSAFLVKCLAEQLEVLVVGRPQGPGSFALDWVLRVLSVPMWASVHFENLLQSAGGCTQWFVNRPAVAEMRRRDMQCYAILSIQSWRRGPPLIPAGPGEEDVTIDAGQRDGLTSWVRYDPRMVRSSSFLLSEYLTLFLQRIGAQAAFYQSVDGQELLSYQCAVAREDWDRVRPHFQRAYALQKAAYRRSRGGRTAPSLIESLDPRFRDDHSLDDLRQRLRESIEVRTVIRKTFVEVDDSADLDGMKVLSNDPGRRHR
mmetsp:Transcript_48815/g.114687  ORF Transcript_48815/g.114687 Transcript_48815/m.114687 type:complete len:397 (+) Transcript_48815:48-1238(+)